MSGLNLSVTSDIPAGSGLAYHKNKSYINRPLEEEVSIETDDSIQDDSENEQISE